MTGHIHQEGKQRVEVMVAQKTQNHVKDEMSEMLEDRPEGETESFKAFSLLFFLEGEIG